MLLSLYIVGVSLLGLIGLFGFQTWQLREGKIARLPNIQGTEVFSPVLSFLYRWFLLLRERMQAFTYPILLLLYKALLDLLHRLTSRIALKFNHLADTIKGKALPHDIDSRTLFR